MEFCVEIISVTICNIHECYENIVNNFEKYAAKTFKLEMRFKFSLM